MSAEKGATKSNHTCTVDDEGLFVILFTNIGAPFLKARSEDFRKRKSLGTVNSANQANSSTLL